MSFNWEKSSRRIGEVSANFVKISWSRRRYSAKRRRPNLSTSSTQLLVLWQCHYSSNVSWVTNALKAGAYIQFHYSRRMRGNEGQDTLGYNTSVWQLCESWGLEHANKLYNLCTLIHKWCLPSLFFFFLMAFFSNTEKTNLERDTVLALSCKSCWNFVFILHTR